MAMYATIRDSVGTTVAQFKWYNRATRCRAAGGIDMAKPIRY
jgi:hypothetical protein